MYINHFIVGKHIFLNFEYLLHFWSTHFMVIIKHFENQKDYVFKNENGHMTISGQTLSE